MGRTCWALCALSVSFILWGCTRHEVEIKPVRIEVAPIKIEVDVNIRVEKQLNDLFAFEDELEEKKPAKKEKKSDK